MTNYTQFIEKLNKGNVLKAVLDTQEDASRLRLRIISYLGNIKSIKVTTTIKYEKNKYVLRIRKADENIMNLMHDVFTVEN